MYSTMLTTKSVDCRILEEKSTMSSFLEIGGKFFFVDTLERRTYVQTQQSQPIYCEQLII